MVKDPLAYNKILTIEMQKKSVDFLASVRIRRRADVSYLGLPDRFINGLVNKKELNKINKDLCLLAFLVLKMRSPFRHDY